MFLNTQLFSIALLCVYTCSEAFLVPPSVPQKTTSIQSTEGASVGSAEDLFASAAWQPIERDMNALPVFTCANAEGNPLAYTLDTPDGKSYTVPFFFTDVDDCQDELDRAKEKGATDLSVIPYPLGKAFQLWALDKAVIVPNKEAVVQAGAPPGVNPIGQQVPLFACMDIMRSTEDGGSVLPMFMTYADAEMALKEAVGNDGGNVDDFEVVSLSLNKAVEQLVNNPETPSFQFVASEKSFNFINKYNEERA